MEALFQLDPGQTAPRVTPDGKYVSILDIIACAGVGRNSTTVWSEIKQTVLNDLSEAERQNAWMSWKFTGKGQRDTPVISARGLTSLLLSLPGRNAAKFRRVAGLNIVRYLGGDETLVAELQRNREIAESNPATIQAFMRNASQTSAAVVNVVEEVSDTVNSENVQIPASTAPSNKPVGETDLMGSEDRALALQERELSIEERRMVLREKRLQLDRYQNETASLKDDRRRKIHNNLIQAHRFSAELEDNRLKRTYEHYVANTLIQLYGGLPVPPGSELAEESEIPRYPAAGRLIERQGGNNAMLPAASRTIAARPQAPVSATMPVPTPVVIEDSEPPVYTPTPHTCSSAPVSSTVARREVETWDPTQPHCPFIPKLTTTYLVNVKFREAELSSIQEERADQLVQKAWSRVDRDLLPVLEKAYHRGVVRFRYCYPAFFRADMEEAIQKYIDRIKPSNRRCACH